MSSRALCAVAWLALLVGPAVGKDEAESCAAGAVHEGEAIEHRSASLLQSSARRQRVGPAPAPPRTTTMNREHVTPVEWTHWKLLNELRAKGFTCPKGKVFAPNDVPIVFDCRLWRAARLHSQDMDDNDYFAHDSLDGTSPWKRAKAQGLSASSENIQAGGSPTGAVALERWQGSDGHCKNMMDPGVRMGAVGTCDGGTYWTQMFRGGLETADESCYPDESDTPASDGDSTFELWVAGSECTPNAYEKELGKFDSVDDCKDACLEAGGSECNYFIYGQPGSSKAGSCWWEFDKACESGTTFTQYDIYKRASVEPSFVPATAAPTPAPAPPTMPTGTTAAASTTFSLWKEKTECVPNRFEKNLGKYDSVDECRDACLEKAGSECNYFIFGRSGTGKAGKCYWEYDKACESGFDDAKYDLYKRDSMGDDAAAPTPTAAPATTFELWKEKTECVPNRFEKNLGKYGSVDECRDACLEKGGSECNYFIFGRSGTRKAGKCYWEYDKACESDFDDAKYDLYRRTSSAGGASTPATPAGPNTFEVWREGAECMPDGLEKDLGTQGSPEECRDACIAAGGGDCNFFIFGHDTAWHKGSCWWEFDQACQRGTVEDSFDVYKRTSFTVTTTLPSFALWKEGTECYQSGCRADKYEKDLGTAGSLKECRELCLKIGGAGCNYFIFGQPGTEKEGKCYWEYDNGCDTGFKTVQYDLYKRSAP